MKRLLLASLVCFLTLASIGLAQADDFRPDSCLPRASNSDLLNELSRRLGGFPGPGPGPGPGNRQVSATYFCNSSNLTIQLIGPRGMIATETMDLTFSSNCNALEEKLVRGLPEIRRATRIAYCNSSMLHQLILSAEGIQRLAPVDLTFSSNCNRKADEIMANIGL